MPGNFSNAGFKGEAPRKVLQAAAKATTPAEFANKMEEMTTIDLDVAKWFDDKPPAQWSRAYFSTYPKCDILLNNVCECFNSNIVDVREKPIIEMMELLRLYMKQRLQQNRKLARLKWKDQMYYPRILNRVQKEWKRPPNAFLSSQMMTYMRFPAHMVIIIL